MNHYKQNPYIKGAFLLTFAGLISKILSASYRIPLQNLTGDLGFYIYQQIYPIIGIVLILTLYGFPSAISRIVVDLEDQGNTISVKSFFLPILFILIIFSFILCTVFYFGSPFFVAYIGDINLIHIYEHVPFIFLFLPFVVILRGIYQSKGNMKPTAISQIGEQIVRVIVIIVSAYFIAYKQVDIYDIGKAGIYASIVGLGVANLILLFYLRKDKWLTNERFSIPWRNYTYMLFTLGVIGTLNHMILLLFQFVDLFTLLPGLVEYGLQTTKAMSEKGIFDRGQPLIQLGTVIGSSFALAIIPSISKERLRQWKTSSYHHIRLTVAYSFYLAIGATIGLMIIFPETNQLLYQNTIGTFSLRILSMTIFFSTMVVTGATILQGFGYIKQTALFIILAIILKGVLNEILVPIYGISGSALATVVGMGFLFTLLYQKLRRLLPNISLKNTIHWIGVSRAILVMSIYLFIVKFISPSITEIPRSGLFLYVLFIVFSGSIIYLFTLIRNNVFTEEELAIAPFSSILIRMYKGRDKR